MATNNSKALPTYGEIQTILTPINDAITNLNSDSLLKSDLTNLHVNETLDIYNILTQTVCGRVTIEYTLPQEKMFNQQIIINRCTITNNVNTNAISFKAPPCYIFNGRNITDKILLTNYLTNQDEYSQFIIKFFGDCTLFFIILNNSTNKYDTTFTLKTPNQPFDIV